MTCYDNFQNLLGKKFWQADFNGDGKEDLLVWSGLTEDQNFYYGTVNSGALNWDFINHTEFGDVSSYLSNVGDINGDGKAELVFYAPDNNCWMATYSYNSTALYHQFTWRLIATGTQGNMNTSRSFVGDFRGNGKKELLLFNVNTANWTLLNRSGSVPNDTYSFLNLGTGFNANSLMWVGRFSQTTKDEVLAYEKSAKTWNLITVNSSNQIVVTQVGSTSGFGDISGLPFYVGDFTPGDANSEIIFYSSGDGTWWMGKMASGSLTFTAVGKTLNFVGYDNGRSVHVGDFTGTGKAKFLYHTSIDNQSYLGSLDTSNKLTWTYSANSGVTQIGSTTKLGFVGKFEVSTKSSLIIHDQPSGTWFMDSFTNGLAGWSQIASTLRTYSQTTKLHFKVLTPQDIDYWYYIEASRIAFRTAGIRVEFGSYEAVNRPDLTVLDQNCVNTQNPDMVALLQYNANAGPNDIIIYLIDYNQPNLVAGCSPFYVVGDYTTGPAGIFITNRLYPQTYMRSRFVMSHEMGHVFDMNHTTDLDLIMTPGSSDWYARTTIPTFNTAENQLALDSRHSVSC